MWTIREVKGRAWNILKRYYWQAFVVSLIALFLGGEGGASVGNSVSRRESVTEEMSRSLPLGEMPGVFTDMVSSSVGIFMYVFTIMIIVIIIVCVIMRIFVGNPVTVGQSRFFMESRALKASAGIGKAFWVFKSGHYLNVVKIMFLRDLYTTLWTFLLIIPGIVKSYEYMMIPFILSENPEADSRDVFALTKDMTGGQKFNLFLVDLSLIGWIILGVLTCGIGLFFVMPYFYAITAEIYAVMRGEISGFPFGGFGVSEEPSVYQQVMDADSI